MYVVYLVGAGLVVGIIQWMASDMSLAASLLMWLLVAKIGLGGIWAFMGHYFRSDQIAEYIGWPAGNPFQKEIAFANLGLGLCGLMSFFFRDGFQVATVVFATCFLGGAFSVHLNELWKTGNRHPGNTGPIFYADIAVPAFLWILVLFK